LIDVKDMARAIDWAVRRDIANGGEFVAVNVGTDEWNYQVKDLAEAVAKTIPGTKISISKDGQPDKRSYKVNFEMFRKMAPKYQPQTDLSTSVRELKDGLESLSFNDANFRNTSYMRLKVLNDLRDKALLNEHLQWQHRR
jgi:nucleoside-diphosphate-sugar epimerase